MGKIVSERSVSENRLAQALLVAFLSWAHPARADGFDWNTYHARQDAERLRRECARGLDYCDQQAVEAAQRAPVACTPAPGARRIGDDRHLRRMHRLWSPRHLGVQSFGRWPVRRLFALPGWHLLYDLRVVFEPGEDWQPPQRAPMASDPGHWQCEVPGCESTSVLLRISRYDEPFRGRCADHLDPDIWRRLHALRNEASVL